jgi:acetyl esterase/lipase
MNCRTIFFIFIMLLSTRITNASPILLSSYRWIKLAPEVKILKNIEYGKAGKQALILDLYLPTEETSSPRPGLIFIHGGGWVSGDKNEFASQAREMAENGYVAICINYRLSPQFHYPAALEDAEHAVRWMRANASKYQVDPEKLGAIGASAGGYLAAFLGLPDAPEITEPYGNESSKVACVVDYYGRMDMTLEQAGVKYYDYRRIFLGKPKAIALPLYQQASPIKYVTRDASPFFIAHGLKDRQVFPINSIKMAEALEKVNVEASLLLLARSGHGFKGNEWHLAWESTKIFLDRHLKQ